MWYLITAFVVFIIFLVALALNSYYHEDGELDVDVFDMGLAFLLAAVFPLTVALGACALLAKGIAYLVVKAMEQGER